LKYSGAFQPSDCNHTPNVRGMGNSKTGTCLPLSLLKTQETGVSVWFLAQERNVAVAKWTTPGKQVW